MATSAKDRGKRSGDLAEVIRRLDEQSAVIDDLKRRISDLETELAKRTELVLEPVMENDEIACCSDDLIGCLDDCVDDVRDLRKRTRHVRTSESRP